MSRGISEDFGKLEIFLREYKIPPDLLDEEHIVKIKPCHKKIYGLLIFLLESYNQGENGVWLNYLKEVTSDLMLALFCWAQGMYKPAELELRCSIENYLKALIAVTEEKIIEEKSVFRIFDKAKGDAHFQHTITSKFLVSFENDYSTLCHTVHSDPKVISPISALGAIAGYIPSNPDEFQTLIIRLAEGYMGCLYFNYPAIIDKMHPENKKDFLDCLQRSTKQKIIKALFED